MVHPHNLYKIWLNKKAMEEYEKINGVTYYSHTPVEVFVTKEGWHVRILGPYPKLETTTEDLVDEFGENESKVVLEEERKPFHGDMSYYAVEDRLLCSHQIDGDSFEKVKKGAEEYAADKMNIYNPSRQYIDGGWVTRENVPAALERWKAKRDKQFEADRAEYEAWLRDKSN